MIEVKLKGDKDIVAAFKDLKGFLPKNALRSALRKGIKRMESAVTDEGLLPYDTGRLLSNIVIKVKNSAHTVRARLVVRTIGDRYNPKNSFYWRFLERGWTDKKGQHHRHEFALRVIEAHAERAAQDCFDAVDQAIDRAAVKARSSRGF